MSITTARTPEVSATAKTPAPAPREWNPLAAFLSYLVPGLGQISQGRVGKGALFFVCVYTLFFYGTALGCGTAKVRLTKENGEPSGEVVEYRLSSNVYLPDTYERTGPVKINMPIFGQVTLPRSLSNLYNKPQFAAQFWVGIASWPAVWQYMHYDESKDTEGDTIFGQYQRTPSAAALNAVHTKSEKHIELGWVFTVIAGVLNILVIYDALAGPAFLPVAAAPKTS